MKLIYKLVIKLISILLLSACNDESGFTNYAIEIPASCEATNIPYGAPIVKIKFTVTENGVIENKSISQTSGYKNIDDVALKNIDTIFLGGEDRGYNFSQLEKVIKKYKLTSSAWQMAREK